MPLLWEKRASKNPSKTFKNQRVTFALFLFSGNVGTDLNPGGHMSTTVTVQQEMFSAADLAVFLGRSQNAINISVSRRDWRLIPKPLKMGTRNFWRKETVEEWLKEKTEAASEAEARRQAEEASAPAKKRGPGRPRKGETAR